MFIDLARALAVVLMVYGHTLDALLAPRYRAGTWFDVWQFQRGLTSCLFLLLSGFAFSVATARHWPLHARPSRAVLRRTRRFAWFVLLGYGLHFPVDRFVHLASANPERWRSFLAVDVLQLIGVTFVGVQLLVLLSRTRRAFMIATLVLACSCVAATPALWSVAWDGMVPGVVAGYLSPSSGSQFPLFPWAGYILLGAGLGQIYSRYGAANLGRFANRVLLVPGVLLIVAGLGTADHANLLFGTSEWSWVPPQIMVRAGSCLTGLAILAHVSRRVHRLPHVFGAVAQETLLIYFVHLCIVYGSIWNPGLIRTYGASLTPWLTVAAIVSILSTMVAMAMFWNWQKHAHPRVARWTTFATGTLLILQLA
jgi:uncharacterized membrane protein